MSQFALADDTHIHTISVTGKASKSVEPDAFEMTVYLEHRGISATKLQSAMQAQMQSIIQFLLEQGLSERQIQSMRVQLYPNYESTPQGRKQSGVALSRQVRITSQDIQNYDAIVDGLLSRGIARIEQFSFVYTKHNEIYESLLVQALKNAKLKASLMAAQLEQSIEGVHSIVESGVTGNNYSSGIRLMAESSPTALPGSEDVVSSVQVEFILAPKLKD